MAGTLKSCWPYLENGKIRCVACEGRPVANMLDARCTCPEFWRGITERPACVVHEEVKEKKPKTRKSRKKKEGQ